MKKTLLEAFCALRNAFWFVWDSACLLLAPDTRRNRIAYALNQRGTWRRFA